MGWWRRFVLCLLVCLFATAPAWAGPGLTLPDDEDAAKWAGALRLAGLAVQETAAPLRLERSGEGWQIVAVAADGQERRVVVDPPITEADREAVAFLARGLLREVLRKRALETGSPPEAPKVPTNRAPGAAEDRAAPPTKGMTELPAEGGGDAVRPGDPLRLDGTDAPDAPVAIPEDEVEVYVTDLPKWRQQGRKVLSAPPLWLRIGAAGRIGLPNTTQIMAGTELFRRGRLRLNLELGGVVARDLNLALPRRFGHFDVEGTANIAVVGSASVGGGVGTSYRMYRQQGFLVDQHLVPTAQLRLDVPLVSSRKLALVAHVQGKMDLAPTELVLPDGRTSSLNRFEIQPALILRYHGALGLLSDYRRRR